MPNGNNIDWLFKEVYRKLLLSKIGSPHRNKELIDTIIENVKQIEKEWRK